MDAYTKAKLDYLSGTKEAIKAALIEKGQEVSASDTFRSYAEKVRGISPKLQEKTATPGTSDIEVVPGSGYDGMSRVTVKGDGNLLPENILAGVDIFGVTGTAAAGGSSADLCYVTFMDHTGTVELGKKAVAVGDNCADPIARGVFDTPTRESDAQYNYSFIGWANTPGGGWDETALNAITEDKTVYAAYAAAVRSYTVTFYDSDGTTVLKTMTVAYGTTPSYTPTKDGYDFVAWTPALTAVTGDTNYTATWKEQAAFATATWEEIIAVAQAGNAASSFAVGDERTETYTIGGVEQTITWVIAGFGCSKVDLFQTESSNIDIVAKHALTSLRKMHDSTTAMTGFEGTALEKWLNSTFYNALPEELRNGIKEKAGRMPCWIPSFNELQLTSTPSGATLAGYGSAFPLFNSNAKRIRTQGPGGDAIQYWTRDVYKSSGMGYALTVATTGASGSAANQYSNTYGVVPGFCI